MKRYYFFGFPFDLLLVIFFFVLLLFWIMLSGNFGKKDRKR
jgi:hypothetical protein